ncbi:Gluconate transport-inducing protein [Coemansia sp. RSA 552]|nr:Gluconate transport-inducing protein [Coemansia sp. RSA 552]
MTETYHGFVDTAHDALLLFEASASGLLPRVQHRFGDRERQTIRSGAVYVWDEEETGMRRWTDGRTWSPSRVHGCFLIYYELEGRRHQFVTRNQGRGSRSAPRGGRADSLHMPYEPAPPSVIQREQGLIKKALSLCTNDKRKLHLVCYYSREDVENGRLTSPTNDSRFEGIQVFEERYPEIGNGSGRFNRYGGGRIRSAAAGRQWKPTSPGRPRPYREVYRYPSYGPYIGPVRHVHAPLDPPPPQPQPPLEQQSPQPILTGHYVHYPVSTPLPQSQVLGPATTEAAYPEDRGIAENPHLQGTAPWRSVSMESPGTYQAYPQTLSAPAYVSTMPPPAEAQPVWQHSEAPRAYNSQASPSGTRRGSQASPVGGLAGQMGGGNGGGAQHGHQDSQAPPPPLGEIKLPSIERLETMLPSSRSGLTSESASRMSSEDMRQLASLRLSLHR